MTPANLETLIRNKFNALNDTFFSSSELYSYIYEAEIEAALECDLIEGSDTDTTVADQRNYSFPTRAYKIKSVLVDDKTCREISLKEGEDAEIWDDATSGDVDSYYQWNETLYLDPPPADAGDTIQIYSFKYPSDPSSSGTLDIPDSLHRRLSSKVLFEMYGKDQNANMAAFYMNKWESIDKPAMRAFMRKRKRGGRFTSVRIMND